MPNQDNEQELFIRYLLEEFCPTEGMEEPFRELLEKLLRYPLIGSSEMNHYMLVRDYLTIQKSGLIGHKTQIINLLSDMYQMHHNTVRNILKTYMDNSG